MENQEELDENLPRNDGRVNDTTSEDNSYHNIHTTDVTIGAGCDASSRRLSGSQPAHNIPYMQLFHYLKQTFPDLKDCDINESIQKFGLNREKCEAELQQRSQGHMTGYYGPWGKGNCWSNRSSPATTRAPPPPAVGSEGAPITRGGTPLTPQCSPLASPFVTTHSSTSHKLRSPINLSGLEFHQPVYSTEPFEYKTCTPFSNCLEAERAVAVSPVMSPNSVSKSDSPIGLHKATVKHYVVSSHPGIPVSQSCRQHSTSSETATENESVCHSNVTSPTSTLPLPSPSLYNKYDRQDTPLGSPITRHAPVYANISNLPTYEQPLIFHYPPPKSHQIQPSYVISSDQLYNWRPNVHIRDESLLQKYNELNSNKVGSNSDTLGNNLLKKLASCKLEDSRKRSSITPNRSSYIPNINPKKLVNRNLSRRSRSATPNSPITSILPQNIIASSDIPSSTLKNYKVSSDQHDLGKYVHIEPFQNECYDKPLRSSPLLFAPPPSFCCAEDSNASAPIFIPVPNERRTSASLPPFSNSHKVSASNSTPPSHPKHVASLHFVPSPPHNAHHLLPSPHRDALELTDRSYTSVNLKLRQPTSEPQPSIDIKSTGNSLTYSTSSLDRRHGSRSSLQISIGPTGGSISAMRTNLSKEVIDRSDAAFHIRYSSNDSKQSKPDVSSSECSADIPTTDAAEYASHDSVITDPRVPSTFMGHVPSVAVCRPPSYPLRESRERPQSWYVTPSWPHSTVDSTPQNTRLRRNSLPDCGKFGAPAQLIETPITEDGTTDGVLIEEEVTQAQWDHTEMLYVQGVVVEQKARQEKLEAVLRESYKEKDSLLNEVQSLAESLKRSQREGQQAAANNDQRIEEMQEENCRLQAECDLIEREILQTGEEPEVLDHEYSRGATAVSPSSPLSPLQPHLNLTRGQPPGEHQTGRRLTPTRPAPPPPPQATSQPNFYHEQTESILQSGRWSCSRCTYDNHPDMTTCEICGAIRIPSSTSQQPSSGGLPSHTDQHHRSPPSLVRDQMR